MGKKQQRVRRARSPNPAGSPLIETHFEVNRRSRFYFHGGKLQCSRKWPASHDDLRRQQQLSNIARQARTSALVPSNGISNSPDDSRQLFPERTWHPGASAATLFCQRRSTEASSMGASKSGTTRKALDWTRQKLFHAASESPGTSQTCPLFAFRRTLTLICSPNAVDIKVELLSPSTRREAVQLSYVHVKRASQYVPSSALSGVHLRGDIYAREHRLGGRRSRCIDSPWLSLRLNCFTSTEAFVSSKIHQILGTRALRESIMSGTTQVTTVAYEAAIPKACWRGETTCKSPVGLHFDFANSSQPPGMPGRSSR